MIPADNLSLRKKKKRPLHDGARDRRGGGAKLQVKSRVNEYVDPADARPAADRPGRDLETLGNNEARVRRNRITGASGT